MRRSLVADGKLRGSPAHALQKTGRTGNPWGMPAQDRMAWADGLEVPNVQDNPDCEVLYWVGCAAAYDRRLQKVARSVVKLMQAAEVNFAVLGNAEGCTGEAARRMGDELLFQQLAGKNIETFERFGVRKGAKRIVSHCPHCVNSFRQDYPQLGANLDVIHHTEFLDELIRGGRLKISADKSVAGWSELHQHHLPRPMLSGACAKRHRRSASTALPRSWTKGDRGNAASRTSDLLLRRRWRTNVVRRHC